MTKLRSYFISTLLLALVLAGCGEGPTGPEGAPPLLTELPRELTVAERAVIDASNAFALELLAETHANEVGSRNVFLSPLSASMALGMTMNGAAGNTWTQMRDVLGFNGLEEQEINEAYRDLIALLLDLDSRVTFGLGNSVWAREGVPFYDSFYDRVTTYFDAELRESDFDDPGTVDAMNAWIEAVTQGRISEMVDEIPLNTIMYLFNAIYFEGDWRQAFDPAETADRPFTRADGSTVDVPMMSIAEAQLRGFDDETAMGVELPYGGDAFTAVAVLPVGDRSVADLVAGLDGATWAAWMEQLDPESAREADEVRLPRFQLQYERRLNDDLQGLGMTDAFVAHTADFTRLTPAAESSPVLISEVFQKTHLSVDEQGTEAAAATSVGVEIVSNSPVYHFDRPFLFAIRERLSGTILFIGVIGDPS